MNWNTNDIRLLLQKLTRKNQAAGISAGDLFYQWNAEQLMYFQDIVGRWQKMSNGKAGLNTGLILNETSLTDLSPFIIPETLTIAGGNADKPEDFEYRVSLRVGGVYKCTVIRPDQIPAVSTSVIDAPSVTNNIYYAIEYENYYTFLPNSITSAQLDYIAAPRDILWAYSWDADGRQVYNPGLSVNPKWKKSTIVEITKRTLNTFGVSWKDSDFINAGKAAQLSGN
jgi:hypothetical protein